VSDTVFLLSAGASKTAGAPLMWKWLTVFVFCNLVGTAFVFLSSYLWHRRAAGHLEGTSAETSSTRRLTRRLRARAGGSVIGPAAMGITERVMYTLLVAFNISGAASFIAGWMAIKVAGGWATFTGDKTRHGRAVFTASLLGNILSAVFGVAEGVLFSRWRW
jgi:hypothetical protein